MPAIMPSSSSHAATLVPMPERADTYWYDGGVEVQQGHELQPSSDVHWRGDDDRDASDTNEDSLLPVAGAVLLLLAACWLVGCCSCFSCGCLSDGDEVSSAKRRRRAARTVDSDLPRRHTNRRPAREPSLQHPNYQYRRPPPAPRWSKARGDWESERGPLIHSL